MERDDEIAGVGNSLNFGARQYDSRIARFNSLDSYRSKYASQSPFVISVNNPIKFIDYEGKYAHDPMAAFRWATTTGEMLTEGLEAAGEAAAKIDAIIKKMSDAEVQMVIDQAKATVNTIAELGHHANGQGGVIDPSTGKPIEFNAPFPEVYNPYDRLYNVASVFLPVLAQVKPVLKVLNKVVKLRKGFSKVLWVNKASKMTAKVFKKLPKTGKVDATAIRFSQEAYSPNFSDGGTVKDLVNDFKKSADHADKVEPIILVKYPKDGQIYSVDNRRLRAAQEAGVEIRYEKKEWNELTDGQRAHFDTKTQGESIHQRMTPSEEKAEFKK